MTSNERGFSLAELLVACAVLGLVLAGIFTLQQQAQFAYLMGAARVEAQQNARYALDLMSRELRTAQSITTTTNCNTGATGITFVDENGNTVQYSTTGGTLVRDVNGSVGANDVMLAGVRSLTFTCYQSDGTATATPGNVRMIVIAITTTPESSASVASNSPSLQQASDTAKVRLRNVL